MKIVVDKEQEGDSPEVIKYPISIFLEDEKEASLMTLIFSKNYDVAKSLNENEPKLLDIDLLASSIDFDVFKVLENLFGRSYRIHFAKK